MASPSMLLQHGSFDPSVCDEGTTSNPKSPYACYPGAYSYARNCHENLVYVMPSDSSEPNVGGCGSGGEPVTKNAGSRWREDETEALVEIWRDKICQTRWWKQSKGVRVNKEMWEEIAHLLAEREVFRTPAQCQIRMKNLLQFYRQTIDNRRSEKSWEDLPEYFDIVDRIMTRKETGSGVSGGSSSTIDSKYGEPLEQDLSPPKVMSVNGDSKVYEDEKESLTKSRPSSTGSTEEKKTSNKRKLKCNPEEYPLDTELNHPMHYSSMASIHGPTPRKIPSYVTKSEYMASSNMRPVAYPSFTRLTRGIEACSSSCCSSSRVQCAKKACKDKEGHSKNMPNESVPSIPAYNATEHHNLISTPIGSNTTPELPAQKMDASRNHSCNSYFSVNAPQPPLPPHHHPQQQQQQQQQQQSQQPLPQHYRPAHSYLQSYRGVTPGDAAVMKSIQPHLMFNQDLLQLQYKQMKTLLEIEKKRLEIEEDRLREEKESNNRTSAFLLEAVKILAETFRNDGNNKTPKEEITE